MAWGTNIDQRGAVKPSNLEQESFDGAIGAFKQIPYPSNLQEYYVYNADGTLKYAGYAVKGLATSATGWLLLYYQYDANLRVTSKTVAYNSWDNRATATYT